MKLAILGADAESIELARWAIEQGNHQLVVAYDSESQVTRLSQLSPHVRANSSWEELFLEAVADAVIIGRGGKEAAIAINIDPAERRADQLRKLVQAAVPLIVVCPPCEAIIGFEIEMIRRDVRGVIVPYVPGSLETIVRSVEGLVAWHDNSRIGQVEQIVLEREQTDRRREAILVQLARDAALIRRLIGTIQTVSASGPPATVGRDPLGPKRAELPSLANLSVHFSGDEGLTARWSVVPASGADQAHLSIIGHSGQALLSMPSAGDWTLVISGDRPATKSLQPMNDAEQMFRQLSQALTTEKESPEESDWLSACRDQEVAEAVDRSLSRGRTIELFNEDHTEEQSFKGVMAMWGCLLLVGALAALFLIVVVESLQLPIRSFLVWRLWPVYLLVPIVIFLLLQFLQLAVKREK